MAQGQPTEGNDRQAAAWRSEVRAGSAIPFPTTRELAELEAKWSAFSAKDRTSVETSWSGFCERCVRWFPRQHPSDTRPSPNYQMYRIWHGVRTHDERPDVWWLQLSQVARFARLGLGLPKMNAPQMCTMLELLAIKLEEQERSSAAKAPAASLEMPPSVAAAEEELHLNVDPEQARRHKVFQQYGKGAFHGFYRPLGLIYRDFHAWYTTDWKRCGKKKRKRLDDAADRLTPKL